MSGGGWGLLFYKGVGLGRVLAVQLLVVHLNIEMVVMEVGILVAVVAVAIEFWDFPCRVWSLSCDCALDGFVLGGLQL